MVSMVVVNARMKSVKRMFAVDDGRSADWPGRRGGERMDTLVSDELFVGVLGLIPALDTR